MTARDVQARAYSGCGARGGGAGDGTGEPGGMAEGMAAPGDIGEGTGEPGGMVDGKGEPGLMGMGWSGDRPRRGAPGVGSLGGGSGLCSMRSSISSMRRTFDE